MTEPFDFRKIFNEKMAFIAGNKEKLITAWVAETGLSPTESCLVQQELQEDGKLVTKFWVETKTDRCMTHRSELEELRERLQLAEESLATARMHFISRWCADD